MRVILSIPVLAILAATASPAFADCTAPSDAIHIPDGNTATRDQMIAAQTAVRAYDSAVKAYGDCLQQEEAAKVAAGGNQKQLRVQYAKMNNDQVDKLQKVADQFNDALRAYKAKNSG